MDLNKEIKLGDLFRRKAKDPGEEPVKEKKKPRREKKAKAPKEPRERKSRLGRGEKGEKERAASSTLVARAAPPLRDVPLMRPFNLLPTELPGKQQDTRRLVPYVALGVLGLLVAAGLGVMVMRANADVAEGQARFDELRIELASLEVPSQDPLSGQRTGLAAEKSSRTTALATTLGSRVAFDRLLRELALVLPDGISLIQLAAQAPSQAGAAPAAATAAPPQPGTTGQVQTFTIIGEARDQETVALALARLAVVPELTSVSLVNSTEDPQRNVVSFTMRAAVRQEGAA